METKLATERTRKEELKQLLPEPKVAFALLVFGGILVWFYWSSILHLTKTWWREEDYQHGFFVPVFAVFLLWFRRDMIVPFLGRGSWWGMAFFGLWAFMRLTAVFFAFGSLPELSILPFLAGAAIFVGGWQAFRWVWPSILFLIFMIPLPGEVQGVASQELQAIATKLSVFIIQTFGIPAVAQGNVIQLTGKPLEVAQACSGLRMMMLFFAICVGAAFVARRPLWEKILVIASAAPIAVASNVARIVMTAVLYEIARLWPSVIDVETAETFMHDMAGLLMMPIGLLLLWVEMALLSKLLVEPLPDKPLLAGGLLTEGTTGAVREGTVRRRRR